MMADTRRDDHLAGMPPFGQSPRAYAATLEAEAAQLREDHSDLTEMFNRNLAEVERLREYIEIARDEIARDDTENAMRTLREALS